MPKGKPTRHRPDRRQVQHLHAAALRRPPARDPERLVYCFDGGELPLVGTVVAEREAGGLRLVTVEVLDDRPDGSRQPLIWRDVPLFGPGEGSGPRYCETMPHQKRAA
jgi:hypothetical protein